MKNKTKITNSDQKCNRQIVETRSKSIHLTHIYRTKGVFIGVKSIYKGLLPKQHIKYMTADFLCLLTTLH